MAELADARDLKSREIYFSYRFDPGFRHHHIAEWSSLVARRAHNPKVMRFKSHLRNQRLTTVSLLFLPLGKNGCYDGIVCPSSRIVVSCLLRKSTARLTPCFVSFASKKQQSVVFLSLTHDLRSMTWAPKRTRRALSGSNIASFVVSDRRIANNPKQIFTKQGILNLKSH